MPNLPVPVARRGGAIVSVLEWDQHRGLSAEVQYALGTAIQQHPDLNTEERVDMLADMAGYYHEEIEPLLVRLIGDYGAETVYFAIDALVELGERDREGGSRASVEKLLDKLHDCAEDGYPIDNIGTLELLVGHFGGVEDFLEASVDLVLEVRKEQVDYADTEEDGESEDSDD